MSSGFGMDDVISVGKLCWELYSKVYKVSRDAPEELRGLSQELGNLHNTIQLLTEELKDEDSTLRQSGEIRISSVRRIMEQSKETLNKMQRLSERYVELQTPADAREKRRAFRILWDQLKYSRELHNINDRRSKLMLHNSQLALILQGAQNSSLERIEKQNAQADKKLDELRHMLLSDRAARDRPMLTAPLDPDTLSELTNIFLQKAESDNRPWASIGIDSWLQAGRWWLMKAQSQLDAKHQQHDNSTTYNQGYANLLKACWILTDVIAVHPQRTHIGSSNDRRAYYIQRFAQVAISQIESLQIEAPKLEEVLKCNLDIWNPSPSTTVAPRTGGSANQGRINWQTHDGEIVFQRFAEYDSKVEPPVECMIILEIQRASNRINLIAQNFMGQDIRRYEYTPGDGGRIRIESIRFIDKQDMHLLEHIIESLTSIECVSLTECCDASMIYSIMVLELCVNFQYYLNDTSRWSSTEGDINILIQSRSEAQISPTNSLSSHLQSIADRAVNDIKKCSKGLLQYPNQMFWIQRHHCIWMLICRFCNTHEEFSTFWNTDGVPVIRWCCTEECLVASGLLRRDLSSFHKLIPYVNCRSEWVFEDNAHIASAICDNDITLLQTVLNTKIAVDYGIMAKFLQLACANFKKDHMSLILSKYGNIYLYDVCLAISWILSYHGERELQSFTNLLCSVSIQSRPTEGFRRMKYYTHNKIVATCAEFMQKKSSQKLGLYLDAIRGLNIPICVSEFVGGESFLQVDIFPAIISHDLSMLKIMFERNVLSTHMKPIVFREGELDRTSGSISKTYPPQNMPHWPLYIAIRHACDPKMVEYLCQAGACLEQERSGNGNGDDGEPEILWKLHALISVEAAREDFLSMRKICCTLSIAARYRFHTVSSPTVPVVDSGYQSFPEVWITMGQIMLEDGYCNFDGLTRSDIALLIGKDDERVDRCVKDKKTWPIHLQTQENWDIWRLEVVDILERVKTRSSECQICKSRIIYHNDLFNDIHEYIQIK